MQSCGACHDTAFIEQHSFHSDLGLGDFGRDDVTLAQPWDQSSGLFGKWDPLTYRYLSPEGAVQLDMSTAEWLMKFGAFVPGGGPATTARNGAPLGTLGPDAANPETSLLGADGASARGTGSNPAWWRWTASSATWRSPMPPRAPRPWPRVTLPGPIRRRSWPQAL